MEKPSLSEENDLKFVGADLVFLKKEEQQGSNLGKNGLLKDW